MEEGAWDRAVEQARGRESAGQVVALTLDGVVKCAQGKLPKAKVFTAFTQLRCLSIANIGLSSLADFPSLSLLERLILSDNRIAGGLEHLVYAGLKSLREVDLSNNRIQAVEDLKPLAQLKLESLDLYECPVTRSADYRAKVFDMMESLRFLDNTDVAGNERPESEDESEEDDLNVDGVEGEEVEGGWNAVVAEEENGEEGEEDEERDIEGDYNEEFRYEEVDEGGSYQEEVVATAASVRGVILKRVKYEQGSDDVEGEEDNVEVQDVDEASGEDTGEEDDDNADIKWEGEEEELASGAHVSLDERDVHQNDDEECENGELEEDDEDDDGVDNDGEEEIDNGDEKEEYGIEYLLEPIGQSEEDEGASDFEPGDEEEDDEDFDDELDSVSMKKPSEAGLNRKRIREETGESDDRSAKH